MIGVSGAALPLLALIWPLALACATALPPVRAHAIRLLPLAPLPALWMGLQGAQAGTSAPFLLLGVELEVTSTGALLVAMTAAIWLAAGIFARSYLEGTHHPAVFAGFWCLTLAGNLGVFVATDVVTFYVAFATVSLASYILIVHDATSAAMRAGRIYVVMVILGEVCLLAAFVIGIAAADTLDIAQIRVALPDAPLGGVATLLMIAGFGVKAGLVPVHVWLPLAHPAAPTPASAVLSGAIVKAGIIGMMLFLPAQTGLGDWLVFLGFAGAFGAALAGLLRTDPKAVLAYSTISQMSLVVGLIAATGIADSEGGFDKITYYAVHHGLAKGALFLSVGLVGACAGGWRVGMLICVAAVALSVSGAPLTGGNLTKLAVKSGLEGAVEMALTLTAITTTLVLAWFIWRLTQEEPGRGRPPMLMALPTLALGGGALVVPWLLGQEWSGLKPGYALKLSEIWASTWPIVMGVLVTLLFLWVRRAFSFTASTLVREASAMFARPGCALREFRANTLMALPDAAGSALAVSMKGVLEATLKGAGKIEDWLIRPRHTGLLFIILAAAIAVRI